MRTAAGLLLGCVIGNDELTSNALTGVWAPAAAAEHAQTQGAWERTRRPMPARSQPLRLVDVAGQSSRGTAEKKRCVRRPPRCRSLFGVEH